MKTTLDLPEELFRAIKVRAAEEDLKLKDLVAALLRRGLAAAEQGAPRTGRRVTLPLIVAAHRAAPGSEMTPARVADILNDEDGRSAGMP